jgi:hypothetical protein
MPKPRYRLGLTQPLFVVPPPPSHIRGLTEAELDKLAVYLRQTTQALRGLDEQLGNRLADLEALSNPWREGFPVDPGGKKFGSQLHGRLLYWRPEQRGMVSAPDRLALSAIALSAVDARYRWPDRSDAICGAHR